MSLTTDPRLPQIESQYKDTDPVTVGFWRRFQERFYQLWRELAKEMQDIDNRLPHQGASVVAANNLSVATGADYFQVTGNTQINILNSAGRIGGDKVSLKFSGTPTVKHNQAASGDYKTILLVGAVDFVATANDILILIYDSTDDKWYEYGRNVI